MRRPTYAWTRVGKGTASIAMGYSFINRANTLIVWVHGLGCSRTSFRQMWQQESMASYSHICLDLPGFGQTALPEEGNVEMALHAATVDGLIDFYLERYPHKRYYLVGHSMGGAVILLGRSLEKAAGFACLEGNLIESDCGLLSKPASQMEFAAFKKAWPEYLNRELPDAVPYLSLADTKPRAFWETARSLVAHSKSGELFEKFEALQTPACYVHGARSKLPVLEQIRKPETISIPHADHFMMNQNPKACYGVLASFFSTN